VGVPIVIIEGAKEVISDPSREVGKVELLASRVLRTDLKFASMGKPPSWIRKAAAQTWITVRNRQSDCWA
jgi:hypothetical protein